MPNVKRTRSRRPRAIRSAPKARSTRPSIRTRYTGRRLSSRSTPYSKGVSRRVPRSITGDLAKAAVGSMYSNLTGLADYKYVHARNTLLNFGTAPPQIFSSKSKSVIIRHREYIGDVFGKINFTILATYTVNPGDTSTFPWLSQIATSFQEWRMNGCVFEFKSTSGDALSSTNSSLGEVVISSQYNASDTPFFSKVQMDNEEFATSVKPSCSAIHGIECERRQSPLSTQYIRKNGIAVDSAQFYDLCNTSIATGGQQADGANLGELWVSYEIELFKPHLNVASDQGLSVLSGAYTASIPANVGGATPFAGFIPSSVENNLLLTFPTDGSGFDRIVIPKNQLSSADVVQILWQSSGSTTTLSVALPSSTLTNLAPYNILGSDTTNRVLTTTGSITNNFIYCAFFQILDGHQDAELHFELASSGFILPTSCTGADVTITQWNKNVT